MFKERVKLANILVVEDNHIDVMVVKALLDKYFNLHICTNPQAALDAIENTNFDIVLTDINLKDDKMNGVELMKKIRENEKHSQTKIFAVTAYYENRNYFLEQGFDELLTKPVIKEDILDILNLSISAGIQNS